MRIKPCRVSKPMLMYITCSRSTCFRIIGDEEVLYEMNLHLPPGGSPNGAGTLKSQVPDQSPGLAQAFTGHQTPPGPSMSGLPSG